MINVLLTMIHTWLRCGEVNSLFLIFCFFFLCFKGLKYCTLFLFLPMQFNPLEIALVQYVYTLYMHVWFCLCSHFYFKTFRFVAYHGPVFFFFVILFTAYFSCFRGVLLLVHEITNCLAIYFQLALKLYSC